MAQRNFSSPLRISVIAEIFFIFFCGSISLQLTVAKSTITKVIDHGGVSVPQTLPLNSRHKIAIRNRPLVLQCPITLDPSVRLLDRWWVKDGTKLILNDHQSQSPYHHNAQDHPLQSRIWLNDDGNLHFEKVVHKVSGSGFGVPNPHRNYSDEGEYRCVVKSSTGVVFSPYITLSVAAIEAAERQEITVKARDIALLECQIRSTPRLSSSQVTWLRGENLSLTQEYDSRYKILSSGTLLISSVQLNDAGVYKCTARNDVLNRERSAEINLSVLPLDTGISSAPPKFLPIPSSRFSWDSLLVVDEEEIFVLECIAVGVPAPSITWVLTYEVDNGTTISPLVKILSDGKIGYDKVELTPENANPVGNYTCLATNGVGNPIKQTVQVARLPVLLKQSESSQLPPAKTVRFECKVQNPFSLKWYKDGQHLETGRGRVKQTRGNEIVISNTIRNDSGFYQCEVIAEDRIYAIGTSRLLVENNREAPDAPVDLHCVQNLTNSIAVAWRTVSKLDIKAYSVHYMPIGGEERQQVTKHSNFTIDSLKPHMNYSIYIRSYSGRSASAQSSKIVCKTLEDVPITAIKNIAFEQHGPATQTRIRWRPLTNGEARGKIILYKLQWRPINGEFANVRYIDGEAEEFVLTDLTPGEPYEMRLIPSTSKGWPENKDSFAWIAVPLATNSTNLNPNVSEWDYNAPSLHLTVLNSSSIQVNWSVSKEASIKGFRLTFWTYTEKVDDIVCYGPFYVYDNSVREYLFTNFAPSTSYEITVQSYGETWESDVASKTIKTFPNSNGYIPDTEDSLPSVVGLQAHPISAVEVRLTWERPKFNNTQVAFYYTVKYNEVDMNEFKYIRSTSETVDIKELHAFTSYEFVVQVTGLSGLGGPYSQKVESRTYSGIPSEPWDLNWKVRNKTLIEIEWKPPTQSNGIIDRYWVQYKTNVSAESQDKNSIIGNAGTEASLTSSDYSWKTKPTNTTMMYLENLTLNEYYAVRVKAETKAGIGQPSGVIYVRIFTRLPAESNHMNDGHHTGLENGYFSSHNQQHLGIILGVALGIVCIILCATIIMCRHRCFPLPARPEIGVYVNGNGHPPRSKRSLESLNCVEMKVLESLTAADQHIDTKGGHPHMNGLIPGPNNDGVADPLLMRIVRNPIDHRHDVDVDEEVIPNCVH